MRLIYKLIKRQVDKLTNDMIRNIVDQDNRRSIRRKNTMNHITHLRIKALTIIKKSRSTQGALGSRTIITRTLNIMPSNNNTPSTNKKLYMLSDLQKKLNTKREILLKIIRLNILILLTQIQWKRDNRL